MRLHIALAPAVLGRGVTLFGRDLPRRRFTLLEARPLQSGLVIFALRAQSPKQMAS